MDYNGVIGIIFNRSKDKIIIVLNRRSGNISLPSGAIEIGESALVAVQRETQEETGLIIKDFIETDIINSFIYNKAKDKRAGLQAHQKVFYAIHEEKVSTPKDNNVIWAKWFTIEEAISMLTFREHIGIIQDVLKIIP